MSHKLKCLHWGLPCFQLSFHWCLTQWCVRIRVLGLFHPNSQFSPGWVLDCSVHLPYSLQGVGSTWCFCPLPQNHELFLTTHQLPPSPWVGLSWSWVCGITTWPNLCPSPILNLFAGKGWKTGLHLGFPYLEKRKSGWTVKCLETGEEATAACKCLPHRCWLPSGSAPRATWSSRAPLPAQQRKQLSKGLWAMLAVQNWYSEKLSMQPVN